MSSDRSHVPAHAPRRRASRARRGAANVVLVALALLIALGGTAFAATGGTFVLGRKNIAETVTTLSNTTGPALSLQAPAGAPPLRVNRSVRVANLNADLLDGKDASTFTPKSAFDKLKAEHAALQASHAALTSQHAALEARVVELEARPGADTQLAARVADLEALLAGVERRQVAGQPTIRFDGVNLQLVNGSGRTDVANGRGNLLLGYAAAAKEPRRTGSHYLVIGDFHSWTSTGGIVAGHWNTADGFAASVLGGERNTASGHYATVTGGLGNTASGTHAVVAGGGANVASGTRAAVTGGAENTASGLASSVTGGRKNVATGNGDDILRDGDYSTVSGGHGNTANGYHASIAGGKDNVARGRTTAILGGAGRMLANPLECHPACS
ncbi:hypothetical protein [Egicoccus sp. AB-alg2]|uniref:hypothetical protein n=1 Tax=Egicoccus sp. AB-alg2 TaxID=3242693 RepID=UPI00359E473E